MRYSWSQEQVVDLQKYLGRRGIEEDHTRMRGLPSPSVLHLVQQMAKASQVVKIDERGARYRQNPGFCQLCQHGKTCGSPERTLCTMDNLSHSTTSAMMHPILCHPAGRGRPPQ